MDSNHKTQDIEWNTQKKRNTYVHIYYLDVSCVTSKSGNEAQHYKRIARQMSNDCPILSVLRY